MTRLMEFLKKIFYAWKSSLRVPSASESLTTWIEKSKEKQKITVILIRSIDSYQEIVNLKNRIHTWVS